LVAVRVALRARNIRLKLALPGRPAHILGVSDSDEDRGKPVASEEQEGASLPGVQPGRSNGRRSRPTVAGEKLADAIEFWKKHPWWRLIACIVAVLAVLGSTNQLFGWPPSLSIPKMIESLGQPSPSPSPTGPSDSLSPSPSAIPSATPTITQPAPEVLNVASSGRTCPNPNPSDFKLPDVEVCVTMWCQSRTYERDGTPQMDQTQIKLKASVFNKTTGPLDISITGTSAMRLLVAQRNLPESWRPPEKTVAAGDTPVLVEWSGSGSKQNYWALPPNVFADSYATPAGAATGFYTQWDPPILESGEGYYRPRAEPFDPFNADGNLVFQLPVGSVVTGLAVVDKTDPTKIIAVTPFSEWKDREVPPYTF
jgi:hypothetical protein